MLNFDMNVKNFFFASIVNQEQVINDIKGMIADQRNFNKIFTKEDIDSLLDSYGVEYYELPQDVKDLINGIDLED